MSKQLDAAISRLKTLIADKQAAIVTLILEELEGEQRGCLPLLVRQSVFSIIVRLFYVEIMFLLPPKDEGQIP